MAERSKAPDSRAVLFVLTERSGPRMWAWVRIPLLTKLFFWLFRTPDQFFMQSKLSLNVTFIFNVSHFSREIKVVKTVTVFANHPKSRILRKLQYCERSELKN